MKIPILCLLFFSTSFHAAAQKIIDVIYVGPGGITEDAQKATGFIIVKQYAELHYERLDYKKGGPLVRLRSFKDPDLKILDGRYFDYAPSGVLRESGKYEDNLKTGDWRTYDDTGKVIKLLRYKKDSVVEVVDLDRKDSVISYPDEKEATFPGGDKAWKKFLLKKLGSDNPADKSFNGGQVYINFVVAQDGSIVDIFVSKSAEYILDETSIKIIASSPKWNPAFQNGKHVRAYRRQPLTFVQ